MQVLFEVQRSVGSMNHLLSEAQCTAAHDGRSIDSTDWTFLLVAAL